MKKTIAGCLAFLLALIVVFIICPFTVLFLWMGYRTYFEVFYWRYCCQWNELSI